MPENTYEQRVLSASDKAVLYALDRLLDSSHSVFSWFVLERINARVKELFLGTTSLIVKQCLDQLTTEGIVKQCFSLWSHELMYTLNFSPEVEHLRRRVNSDITQCNAVLSYNSSTQETYERAVVACLAASTTETIQDSVATVYNRRLTERTKHGVS